MSLSGRLEFGSPSDLDRALGDEIPLRPPPCPTPRMSPPLTDILLVPIVTLHLVCNGLAMWGPVLALSLEWRPGRSDAEASSRLGRRVACWSIGALAASIVLGLAAGMIGWHGGRQQTLEALFRVPRWANLLGHWRIGGFISR